MRVLGKTLMGAAIAGTAGVWAYKNLRRRPQSLWGKTALITGGSRGLGLALAIELAAQGCRLALVARDEDRLAEAAQDPRLENADVLLLPCDVSDEQEVEEAIERVVQRFGRIDILINNAGVIQVGPVAGMTIDDYREAADVMYWGPLHAILASLPYFRRQGGGSIVNITSVGGKVSVPHLVPYSAAKFALVGLSEGLAVELRREGIHVMTVVPGLMRTGSHINAKFRGVQARELTWFGLSGNVPGLSMLPADAAKQIVGGIRLRRGEIVLGAPAKLLCRAQAAAPGVVAFGLATANYFLPRSPDGSTPQLKGQSIINRKKGVGVRTIERLGRRAVTRYQ